VKLARDFLRYNLVAAGSAAADWLVFLALGALGANHLWGQFGGRLCGGLFSFTWNRLGLQGPEGGRLTVQGRRFVLLYVASLNLSMAVLYLLVNVLGLPVVAGKLAADTTCFVVNFAVMRGYVFRPTAGLTRRLGDALRGLKKAA
jgi:putative flippase GtrA